MLAAPSADAFSGRADDRCGGLERGDPRTTIVRRSPGRRQRGPHRTSFESSSWALTRERAQKQSNDGQPVHGAYFGNRRSDFLEAHAHVGGRQKWVGSAAWREARRIRRRRSRKPEGFTERQRPDKKLKPPTSGLRLLGCRGGNLEPQP